jgi:hypothetical protein
MRTTGYALALSLAAGAGVASAADGAETQAKAKATEAAKPAGETGAKGDDVEKSDDAKKSNDAKKSDDDDELTGPVTIKVPSELQGQGFSLRLGRDVMPLDGPELRTERSTRRERVELITGDNRLVDQDKTYIDEKVFDDLSPRPFKVGLFVGAVHANGRAFRSLLQTGSMTEVSLDGIWQPSAFGFAVSLATLSAEKDHDPDVTSTYQASQTRLLATYELAPFGKSSLGRRWHFTALAGLEQTRHTIEITDGVVTIADESRGLGPWGGVQGQYPFGSFWVSARVYGSYETIEFEDLDFETKAAMTGALLGGMYAF